ncbi:MAG: ABC-2 family transporter protein [Nanoarchaeota archaeon]|nr:ABC-2 family transporter protein [Nanoarchaeota archaeon]
MRALKVFLKFLEIEWGKTMAYRINFLLHNLSILLSDILSPLLAILIYHNTPGIPGWTLGQFLLFYGTNIFVWGLAGFFFLPMSWRTSWKVRIGLFDQILVRPIKPVLHLTLTSVDLDKIGEVILGLLIILLSGVKFDPIQLSMYLLFLGCGILVMYSLSLMLTSAAILFVRVKNIFHIIWVLGEFTEYPLSLYSAPFRFFFTFILPFGLVSFYPAYAFFGLLEPSTILSLLLITAFFFLLALKIFDFAIKRYTSAGG